MWQAKAPPTKTNFLDGLHFRNGSEKQVKMATQLSVTTAPLFMYFTASISFLLQYFDDSRFPGITSTLLISHKSLHFVSRAHLQLMHDYVTHVCFLLHSSLMSSSHRFPPNFLPVLVEVDVAVTVVISLSLFTLPAVAVLVPVNVLSKTGKVMLIRFVLKTPPLPPLLVLVVVVVLVVRGTRRPARKPPETFKAG
jgi:hypothetical protein